MAELTKQKPVPTPFTTANRGESSGSDLVRGGYQPVGKVDIAAIRAQAKKKDDDRPTIVKGAYEPVGKVDIAAIRAKAQKPGDDGNARLSPAVTGTSNTSDSAEQPRSLADRSSAFSHSERLTTLPKPKVANKFGSSNFSGTKAPTPGQFGLQSAPPNASTPPIGAASRTFADEGGKTPAQIWAEKKARQTGASGAADTQQSSATPIASQTSGSGQWKSGYAGKSWAPVAINATGRSGAGSIGEQRTGESAREEHEQEEAPSSPAGGVNALKDRFKGGAPMGAPVHPTPRDDSPPPPIPAATRPGPPMSLPTRPRPAEEEDDEEEQSGPNIPPPPRVQRSPTPPTPEEREHSPVRLAQPVSRTAQPIEPPQERKLPPVFPTESIARNVTQDKPEEKEPASHNTARTAGAAIAGVGAGAAVAGAAFGAHASTVDQGNATSGKRALVSYDYERQEDNELELVDGEYITNIEMVDEDWWMGTNSRGESGLFPSNYVELVENEEEEEPEPEPEPVQQQAPPLNTATRPPPAAAPAPASGPTATAIYDYEAAEDNELSFEENATITGLVSFISKSACERIAS